MKPWRCDPYLWVHLAGLATVPLWIDLCLLGLAVGSPTLPGLELGLIVALGVLPLLAMQLWRPFYIFSLPGLALRPAVLHDNQRRLLTQFRQWRVRLGALLVPIPLVLALITLYPLAFLARDITPFDDWGRMGGLAIAALSFLMANLFLQVPVAVLQVLATPDRRWQTVVPYPVERVAADFSWLGLPMGQILPAIAPPISAPQASLKVEVAPSRAEDSSPTEIDGDVETKVETTNAWAISEELPELAQTADLAEAYGEAHAQGDTTAPEGQSHPGRESPLVTLDHPEVGDLDGGSLARDHAFGNPTPRDESLPPLASQQVSLADRSPRPANSGAKKG